MSLILKSFLLIGSLTADAFPLQSSRRPLVRPFHSLKSDEDGGFNPEFVHVMVNGLPGAMGQEVSAACLRKGMRIAPIAFTGPGLEGSIMVKPEPNCPDDQQVEVKLITGPPDGSGAGLEAINEFTAGLPVGHQLIIVDYTHPTAVNANVAFYAKNNLPFVLGTTGGDRELLMDTAQGKWAVIAPNMAKGIVALQAGVDMLAQSFPGAFSGYTLSVQESHQKSKADTSGTALAVSASLEKLVDTPFDTDEGITRFRGDDASKAFGVPESAMGGHAFHTYFLRSGDGTVEFQLQHNVCGRNVYAEGTADAVLFLSRRMAVDTNAPQVFSMIDVLKEGGI